jgi:hypothetical protein
VTVDYVAVRIEKQRSPIGGQKTRRIPLNVGGIRRFIAGIPNDEKYELNV